MSMKDTTEDEAAGAAVVRFYQALEALLRGQGTGPMKEAWHHTPRVTAMHPMGDIERGWDQILASWEEFSKIGSDETGGSSIRDLRVHRYGDVAYTTCVFVSGPKFNYVAVNCTNVVHKADGVWRVVHHHADRRQAIEDMAVRLAVEKAT